MLTRRQFIGTSGTVAGSVVPVTACGIRRRSVAPVPGGTLDPTTIPKYVNEGPDGPFGGAELGTDFEPAEPGTTGQVLRFVLGAPVSADRRMRPYQVCG